MARKTSPTIEQRQARIAELDKEIEKVERLRSKLVYERCVHQRSITRTGQKMSPEVRARISASHMGIKPTDEARRNMSLAHKRRYQDPEAREDVTRRNLAFNQRKKGVHAVDPIEALIFGGKVAS